MSLADSINHASSRADPSAGMKDKLAGRWVEIIYFTWLLSDQTITHIYSHFKLGSWFIIEDQGPGTLHWWPKTDKTDKMTKFEDNGQTLQSIRGILLSYSNNLNSDSPEVRYKLKLNSFPIWQMIINFWMFLMTKSHNIRIE